MFISIEEVPHSNLPRHRYFVQVAPLSLTAYNNLYPVSSCAPLSPVFKLFWDILGPRSIQLLPSHLLNLGLPYVLTCRSSDLASPGLRRGGPGGPWAWKVA